jgi:uncharacterized membrane protein
MKRKRWIPPALVALTFIGLIDASYVAFHSSEGFLLPCGFAGGCDQVLSSPYSKLMGIPIAWLGLGFYSIVLAGSLFAIFGFWECLKVTFAIVSIAFLFTLYLFYLQAWVIRAFCDYCLLSAFLITLLFALHLWAKPWKSLSTS